MASCFASLFLCMLSNAMWYNTVPLTTSVTNTTMKFTLGPIRLTPEELIIGSLSTLFTLPLILLIVLLFKYSRPGSLRKNRIVEAMKGAEWSADPALQNHITKTTAPTTKRFLLPTACLPLAWIICLATIGLSMFFVWAYGITWGNDRVHQWLSALIVSFITSFFILEPAKVWK